MRAPCSGGHRRCCEVLRTEADLSMQMLDKRNKKVVDKPIGCCRMRPPPNAISSWRVKQAIAVTEFFHKIAK